MGSEGRSFEASFTTERTSIGLNVALETACEKPDQAAAADGLQESSHAFDIPEATVAPCLGSGFLKGLKDAVLLTPTHLVIVMEYAAAGELFDGICNAGRFSEDEVRIV
ncbi:hypothetical protein OIU76_028335 [Salix suchowensis]|nr:hypothetical protein OIU76_028335 [Salix suchowensis]